MSWLFFDCKRAWIAGVALCVPACGQQTTSLAEASDGSGSTSAATTQGSGTTGGTTDASDGGTAGTTAGTGNPRFDVGDDADLGETGTGNDATLCKVGSSGDALPRCERSAPPASFDPVVQWAWTGATDDEDPMEAVATPLVVNLTDDNGDGQIDLCDTPDVVAVMYRGKSSVNPGFLHVFDGATGALHFASEIELPRNIHSAAGDIDGDGISEIVTVVKDTESTSAYFGWLAAFEHDGTLKWRSDTQIYTARAVGVALADLDNDGDVEIMAGEQVMDHNGKFLFGATKGWLPTAADLDGDDDLEVIMTRKVYEHDGFVHFDASEDHNEGLLQSFPHVADLDDDGLPEVMVSSATGITVIEHDGTRTLHNVGGDFGVDAYPAAIHNIVGNEWPEIAIGSPNEFRVLDAAFAEVWDAPVDDGSGSSGSSAFDFLGDGTAEAMYMDEISLYVYGQGGSPEMINDRTSWTSVELPVVADVDNDGHAEIVVVSNGGYATGGWAPAVQVLRDRDDRWVPARRIWNQQTYHVTNVREDGTIPTIEPKHWLHLNTFRTQAQSEDGEVCAPPM